MEYFDMRKMSVNLWRNAAGETREICTFPPAKRDFYWRASIASIAANGEFSLFPGMERIVTLLEGGEMLLESADRFNHTLKPLQPFAFAADQVVKAKLTAGQMSMDFNIMTRLDVCKAKVRIAERTFTTFGSRGGVVFVINGAWQLAEVLKKVVGVFVLTLAIRNELRYDININRQCITTVVSFPVISNISLFT